jgi:hypothetical protein
MAGKFSLKIPDFRDLLHCRKSTTWDPQLYFPSDGRRAEDFFFRSVKSDGFGRVWTRETWVLKVSTLLLDHRSLCKYITLTVIHWYLCPQSGEKKVLLVIRQHEAILHSKFISVYFNAVSHLTPSVILTRRFNQFSCDWHILVCLPYRLCGSTYIKLGQNFLQFPKKVLTIRNDDCHKDQ